MNRVNSGLAAMVMSVGTLIPLARAQEPDPEITRLREQVETRRKELREAEDRLSQALRRREAGANQLPPLPNGERSPFDLDTDARPKPLTVPSRTLPGPTPQQAKASADPSVVQASAPGEDRIAVIEGKLDRLLEVMEGMRREIEELKRGRGR
jgi:hypothetical protein